MKMYVWTDHYSFLAVAHAESVKAAREAIMVETGGKGDGSCREREKGIVCVLEQQPAIYIGPNAEFVVTDSAQLRESEAVEAELRKALDELGAPTEPDAMCAELVKCGTFTEEAGKTAETISIGKDLYRKLRKDRERAEWVFSNAYVQKIGDTFEVNAEHGDYARATWREAVDAAMAEWPPEEAAT